MDRSKARDIRVSVEAKLKELEAELGVTLSVGSGNFSDADFTFKVSAVDNASDGTAQTKEALEFERYAMRYGMSKEDLGREFQMNGDTYTIVGLKPKSRKYPILVKKGSATYKMSSDMVKMALTR